MGHGVSYRAFDGDTSAIGFGGPYFDVFFAERFAGFDHHTAGAQVQGPAGALGPDNALRVQDRVHDGAVDPDSFVLSRSMVMVLSPRGQTLLEIRLQRLTGYDLFRSIGIMEHAVLNRH